MCRPKALTINKKNTPYMDIKLQNSCSLGQELMDQKTKGTDKEDFIKVIKMQLLNITQQIYKNRFL